MISDVIVTPLKQISVPGGDVLHALKNTENNFLGFGEAYFSCITKNSIKAWKRHKKMTMNLIVPMGKVRFVIFDDRDNNNHPVCQSITLSRDNYLRLTVPPMVWLGFQGLADAESIILNLANMLHDPDECDKQEMSNINFDWNL